MRCVDICFRDEVTNQEALTFTEEWLKFRPVCEPSFLGTYSVIHRYRKMVAGKPNESYTEDKNLGTVAYIGELEDICKEYNIDIDEEKIQHLEKRLGLEGYPFQ